MAATCGESVVIDGENGKLCEPVTVSEEDKKIAEELKERANEHFKSIKDVFVFVPIRGRGFLVLGRPFHQIVVRKV